MCFGCGGLIKSFSIYMFFGCGDIIRVLVLAPLWFWQFD